MANYINNKSLYQVMKQYHEDCKNDDNTNIPNDVGRAILLICQKLAYKPNFINYTYRDDMISDGIENCIASVKNFNPERSTNPFAYFTQIAWNAFIRRIQKEKKQTYIKHKNLENQFTNQEMMNIFNETISMQQHNEYSSEVIRSFEEKEEQKKKK